ncbi:helix-turn-helix transcriptional regulator, partial [bacterium]|nr:helix-turn-helix transcriptional regulator [bacterium]
MLKKILKKTGWTQEQLARHLDVSFSTLNSWLHGKATPTESSKKRIVLVYQREVVHPSQPKANALNVCDKDGQKLTFSQFIGKVGRRLHAWGLEIWTGFLWWGVGLIPFHWLRRFFYRLSGMKIGRKSTIHMMSRLY